MAALSTLLNLIKILASIVTAILGIWALKEKMYDEIKVERTIIIPGQDDHTIKRVLTLSGKRTLIGICVSGMIAIASIVGDSHLQNLKAQAAEKSAIQSQSMLVSVSNSMANLQVNFEAETNAMVSLRSEYDQLLHVFSVNTSIPEDYRAAILNSAFLRVSNYEVFNEKQLHTIDLQSPDLETIREQTKHKLAIQEAQKTELEIQQEKQKMMAEQEVERLQKEGITNAMAQAWADKELIEFERLQTKQVFLPLFDTVVVGLDRTISNASGRKTSHDFNGLTPSAYTSNFVTSDGRLRNGTNVVFIGDNPAWHFEISTEVKNLNATMPGAGWSHGIQDRFGIRPGDRYATLLVKSETTNGASLLTIAPDDSSWNLDSDPKTVSSDHFSEYFYSQIQVKLTVPNGLNIDTNVPMAGFTNALNDALSTLIGAQDQQFPLQISVKK